MPNVLTVYTIDHPEANGRKLEPGEHAYRFLFPLADGSELEIHCGDQTMCRFQEFIGSMIIDDDAEASTQPNKENP